MENVCRQPSAAEQQEIYRRIVAAEESVKVHVEQIKELKGDLKTVKKELQEITEANAKPSEMVSTVVSTITSVTDSWQESVTGKSVY